MISDAHRGIRRTFWGIGIAILCLALVTWIGGQIAVSLAALWTVDHYQGLLKHGAIDQSMIDTYDGGRLSGDWMKVPEHLMLKPLRNLGRFIDYLAMTQAILGVVVLAQVRRRFYSAGGTDQPK